MIFLATDFGSAGPYMGQIKAMLTRLAPKIDVIDLFSDLPAFKPDLAAYLLATYANVLETDDVLLAVVDPGVGSTREPLVLRSDNRWLVGPDNGLFELIRRRSRSVTCDRITWRPKNLSASFHGRHVIRSHVTDRERRLINSKRPLSGPTNHLLSDRRTNGS
ncbi:MAG: SAM-dependent chlorinase/fluorinase, partial [Pseudomonadota bacterium]